MCFQEKDVASQIGKILRTRKNKVALRYKADVTGKLRTKIKQLAQENRLKVGDM
jgi:hypothetical protein